MSSASTEPPTRILVVGCSGAGKTTVAAQLARSLAVPHVELDALHWGPNWTATSDEEFRDAVDRATARGGWVVDGNYHGKLGTLVWDRADEVVWIDPPRWRVMWRVCRRTVSRVLRREQLWNGNRESIAGLFFWRGDDTVLGWAWNSYPRVRARYAAAARIHGPKIRRLRTRGAVDRFLAERACRSRPATDAATGYWDR